MNRLHRILCATDFSPDSDAALRLASRLAASNHAALEVLHVLEPEFLNHWTAREKSADPGAPGLPDLVRRRLIAQMGLPGMNECAWTPSIEEGHPLVALARRVTASQADLVVLGARGMGSFGRMTTAVGSLAAKATRKLATRVLMVPAGYDGKITRVVVGMDFSPAAIAALTQAIRFARLENATLEIIHVVYPPERDYYFGAIRESPVTGPPEPSDIQEKAARARIDSLLESAREELGPIQPVIRLPRSAHPGQWLLGELAGSRDTLAVLGTRGRSEFEGFFIGTTAERVVAECPCALLAVKPPGFRSPLA